MRQMVIVIPQRCSVRDVYHFHAGNQPGFQLPRYVAKGFSSNFARRLCMPGKRKPADTSMIAYSKKPIANGEPPARLNIPNWAILACAMCCYTPLPTP